MATSITIRAAEWRDAGDATIFVGAEWEDMLARRLEEPCGYGCDERAEDGDFSLDPSETVVGCSHDGYRLDTTLVVSVGEDGHLLIDGEPVE